MTLYLIRRIIPGYEPSILYDRDGNLRLFASAKDAQDVADDFARRAGTLADYEVLELTVFMP